MQVHELCPLEDRLHGHRRVAASRYRRAYQGASHTTQGRYRGALSATLIPLMLAISACSVDISLPQACTAEVTVSAGTVPTFSWTPACKVDELEVRRLSDQALVWRVFNPNPGSSGQDIAPPVQYGVTPPGAFVNTPPESLVAGQDYSVFIGSLNVSTGSATFTP